MAPLNRTMAPEPGVVPSQAAVLLPLCPTPGGVSILFTLRPLTLAHHPGEISFPGGRAEEDDPSLEATALRETEEELGIAQEHVQLLGRLTPLYILPSNYCVQPFVGWLSEAPALFPNTAEVTQVLSAPLATFLDARTRASFEFQWEGISITAPSYRLNGSQIWGATAMILSEFLEVVKQVAYEDVLR